MTVEILLSGSKPDSALKNVQKKKKSPGIDKMRTWELSAFLGIAQGRNYCKNTAWSL